MVSYTHSDLNANKDFVIFFMNIHLYAFSLTSRMKSHEIAHLLRGNEQEYEEKLEDANM